MRRRRRRRSSATLNHLIGGGALRRLGYVGIGRCAREGEERGEEEERAGGKRTRGERGRVGRKRKLERREERLDRRELERGGEGENDGHAGRSACPASQRHIPRSRGMDRGMCRSRGMDLSFQTRKERTRGAIGMPRVATTGPGTLPPVQPTTASSPPLPCQPCLTARKTVPVRASCPSLDVVARHPAMSRCAAAASSQGLLSESVTRRTRPAWARHLRGDGGNCGRVLATRCLSRAR